MSLWPKCFLCITKLQVATPPLSSINARRATRESFLLDTTQTLAIRYNSQASIVDTRPLHITLISRSSNVVTHTARLCLTLCIV